MKNENNSGFTFVELLVVVSLIGVLATIAIVNYNSFAYKSADATAQTDYRHVKVALLDALTDPDAPDRYIARRIKGPTSLPTPLQAVYLSDGVEATVFFDARRRRNRRPRTLARVQVFHYDGSKTYVYTEVNGQITEQERERRS